MDRDGVILDETAWCTEDNNATIGSIRDGVISDQAIRTAETDAVSPLLEDITAARADIVVLNGDARAGEWTFGDVKTRPGAGIE